MSLRRKKRLADAGSKRGAPGGGDVWGHFSERLSARSCSGTGKLSTPTAARQATMAIGMRRKSPTARLSHGGTSARPWLGLRAKGSFGWRPSPLRLSKLGDTRLLYCIDLWSTRSVSQSRRNGPQPDFDPAAACQRTVKHVAVMIIATGN